MLTWATKAAENIAKRKSDIKVLASIIDYSRLVCVRTRTAHPPLLTN